MRKESSGPDPGDRSAARHLKNPSGKRFESKEQEAARKLRNRTRRNKTRAMAADMKKRGIAFVGPVITYSFLQSIGIVNDHLSDCEYRS